jgi:peptide/nickel transport system ATP-binding protein/oligopeptide transport system ATP-binding protein
MANELLKVENLVVAYETENRSVRAVDDVSYVLHKGETLGVVGESGSGKSTQVMALLRLMSGNGRIVSGRAMFKGRDLLAMSTDDLRAVRGREIGTVFQSPLSSLNPVLTIGSQIAEPIVAHGLMSQGAAVSRAGELLDLVGFDNPGQSLKRYPHQLSGGMRQRVMIAMALSCEPSLLIADEPTTALDVTVQAQILELVASLQAKLGTAVIWVTHDLGVVARIADTVQVMYSGQIMEQGPVRAIFRDPRSAYTIGLLGSLPNLGADERKPLKPISGSAPALQERTVGDPFAPRNPHATERCWRERPPLRQVEGPYPNHYVAAWYDISIDTGG